MDKTIWRLVVLITICSIGHHVDHALRHRAGWPLTDHVTPYTYALGAYVAVIIGSILTRRGVVGPGYWSLLALAGALFIGLTHYGPAAEDPPSAFAAQYGSQTKAAMATVLLWVFLTSLVTATVYSGRRWMILRQRALSSGVTA